MSDEPDDETRPVSVPRYDGAPGDAVTDEQGDGDQLYPPFEPFATGTVVETHLGGAESGTLGFGTVMPDSAPAGQRWIQLESGAHVLLDVEFLTVISAPAPAEPESTPGPEYELDTRRLAASDGDAEVWSEELSRLISSMTGRSFAANSLVGYFTLHETQIARRTARLARFAVANTPIASELRGDPAELALQLRHELSIQAARVVENS